MLAHAGKTNLLPATQAFSFAVGGTSLSLVGLTASEGVWNAQFAEFQCGISEADILVAIRWADQLRSSGNPRRFDSGGVWTLSHEDSHFLFDFTSPLTGVHPYRRLRVDSSFRRAELILNREALAGWPGIFPLECPADELLVTNYLAHHGLGIEVHGCGLVDRDMRAFLFLGHSGTGKSTTARLWDRLRSPEILSDDRIILRFHDGDLWMYGTPWHGDARFASQNRAKLSRIFILRQAVRNEMTKMPKAVAAGELFARSFPPFHSADGLERCITFLHAVVDRVPCYDFGFVPDSSAVEAALKFHE